MNRQGESNTTLTTNRSSRFFEKEGYWYYRTREQVNFGPFDSKHEAEKGASDFIAFITQAKPTVIAMLERMGQQQTAA